MTTTDLSDEAVRFSMDLVSAAEEPLGLPLAVVGLLPAAGVLCPASRKQGCKHNHTASPHRTFRCSCVVL
jgi:hypothetical protein